MANLKEEYTKHIQDTAPDMDKLWSRISEEIDKKKQRKRPRQHTHRTESR